jgi:hypothetical protein
MKTDGRALNHAMLTELRKRGVAAVQSGESPTQVAAALGVNLRSLFRWLALYRCTAVPAWRMGSVGCTQAWWTPAQA